MIQVTGIVSATTTNILAGTDLQSAPSAGVVLFWVASTVATSVVTITAPPVMAARAITPHIRTNGVPDCSADSPVALPVRGGEQITLQATETDPMTLGYVVKFIPKEEL